MADIKIDIDVEDSELIYNQYNTGDRASYGEQIAEDRDFTMNAMWETEDANALDAANEPAITVNEITPSIDLVVSMLTENNPRFMFGGTQSDDISIAADISDLHAHIYDISNGQSIMKRSAMDYEVAGMGAFMTYVDGEADNGKGEILIADVDPQDLYIDPLSKKENSSDAEHILVVKNLTQEYVKQNYPELDINKLQMVSKDDYPSSTRDSQEDQVQYPDFSGVDTSKASGIKYRAIDRYSKIRDKRFHVTDNSSGYEKIFTQEQYNEYLNELAVILVQAGQETYVTTAEARNYVQMAEENEFFHLMIDQASGLPVRMAGVEHSGSVPNSTTQIKVITKGQLVGTVIEVSEPTVPRIRRIFSIGKQLVMKDTLPVKDHPIVTFRAHDQRNPYPMSDVRLVRPLQEQLNKMNSKIVAYLNKAASMNVFFPKGSGIKKQFDKNAGKAGINTYEYDAELGGVPIVAQMPPLPAGIFEDKQSVIYQIQRIIGAYAASDGNVAQMPETKGGTILQDEFGQRRVNMKRKDLERALNQLAKVIAQLIPHVYKEEKVIRITEPNRDNPETRFNVKNADKIINDLTVGIYDVKVISGSTAPTNQMMRYELLNNAFQTGVLRDNKALIENLPFIPNIDEILEREDRLKQAMQQIEAMDEEIKKLQGDLQTANRAEVQAEKKVEVQKFKADLSKTGSDLQADVKIAKARISDEVKKNKPTKQVGK
jgi:hypothetical protein